MHRHNLKNTSFSTRSTITFSEVAAHTASVHKCRIYKTLSTAKSSPLEARTLHVPAKLPPGLDTAAPLCYDTLAAKQPAWNYRRREHAPSFESGAVTRRPSGHPDSARSCLKIIQPIDPFDHRHLVARCPLATKVVWVGSALKHEVRNGRHSVEKEEFRGRADTNGSTCGTYLENCPFDNRIEGVNPYRQERSRQ